MLSQLQSPSAQIAVDSPRSEDVVRSLHQESSQIWIALFADVHLWLALSRVAPSGLEAYVAGCIPALAETIWIFQRQDVGKSDQGSHTLDLLQPLCFRIPVLRH